MVTARSTRLTGWIATLAFLLASLAPWVSHASRAGSAADWLEVCTAQGSRWVAADVGDSEPAPADAQALEHCPYCSTHTPTLGLPPVAEVVCALPVSSRHVPRAFLAAPHTLHAWASAQPRAPPLFS